MVTFALIAEGLTDQVVLERIIEQLLDSEFDDGIDVNFLQPLRDKTDEARAKDGAPHAGWELVLEFCRVKMAEALFSNDYVVVQIDTDLGDHVNFGLPLTKAGVERPYHEIVEDGSTIIRGAIGEELFAQNSERVIFAISVHSLESWLILYFFNKDRTKNCFFHLCRELKKENGDKLTKNLKPYQALADKIKAKRLDELSESDSSFGHFIRQLNSLPLRSSGCSADLAE